MSKLHEQVTDRCLPPGTLGHDACHAEDQEQIAQLKALLRECEEPLRLLAASQALRARIAQALEP